MPCSDGPYNARYSLRQTEEALFFYLYLSRIDFIGRAEWTCQADTLWYEPVKLTPCDMNLSSW